jgi:hypothetical protein
MIFDVLEHGGLRRSTESLLEKSLLRRWPSGRLGMLEPFGAMYQKAQK